MFESDVGFSVSFTRQCCGIGSRTTDAPPAAAAGATPARAAGGGGGLKTPAGTTSADITIVCGVDSARIASQLADVVAATSSAAITMTSSYCAAQDQFAESFRSPVPLYFAYCGYGHSGLDSPELRFVAAIVAGVTPCSRHFSSVPIVSNVSGPLPPRQWPMPGTMKSSVKSFVSFAPIFFTTLW